MNLFVKMLYLVLSLACVYFLDACTGKFATSNPSGPTDGAPSAGGSSRNNGQAQGTGDPGGGTGLDGKVFESYSVKIETLPAYVHYLKPLFDNIVDEVPSKNNKDSDSKNRILNFKTWYIAPVELEKIDKPTLGVSFMNNETDQIARQTLKEIWISKVHFDKMSEQDQAQLILHEIVMMEYMIKFFSIEDLCAADLFGVSINNSNMNLSCSDLLRKIMSTKVEPEKVHTLDSSDNENIRYVTSWLWNHRDAVILNKDMILTMASKNFDKRFFNNNFLSDNASAALKNIDVDAIYQAVAANKFLNRELKKCYSTDLKQYKNCSMTYELKVMPGAPDSYKTIILSIEIEGEDALKMQLMVNSDKTLYPLAGSTGNYAIVATQYSENLKYHFGDRLQIGVILLKKESDLNSGIYVDRILFKSGVITQFKKEQYPYCFLNKPVTPHFSDNFIMNQDNNEASIEEPFLLNFFDPSMGQCYSSNFVQN